MDYDNLFTSQLEALRAEGRYRVFADLERICGAFPRARRHRHGGRATSPSGAPTTISAWASIRP